MSMGMGKGVTKCYMRSLLDSTCPSVPKIFESIFSYLIALKSVDLHIICEEIFSSVELHAIQKKCTVTEKLKVKAI